MSTISGNNNTNSDNGEFDFASLFYLFLENKWLILLITSITLFFGAFYASKQVPQFQSSILLQMSDKQQNAGGLFGAQSMINFSFRSENPATIQTSLIKSRFILQPVIESLGLNINLVPVQSFWGKLFSSENKSLQVTELILPPYLINDSLLLSIDKNNQVQLSTLKGKILLTGLGDNKITNEKKDIGLHIVQPKKPIHGEFTIKKLPDINVINSLLNKLTIKDLGGKEHTGVLELSLKNPDPKRAELILNTIAKTAKEKDAQKKSLEASKTLVFLYKQLPITKAALEKAETDLNKYRARSGKVDIKLQTQALLAQLSDLDKEISKFRITKIQMQEQYTDKHPAMIEINSQAAILQSEQQKLEKKLKALPSSDQVAASLMRDVEVKNNLYMILLNKIQELQVIKAGTVSDVRILSFASIPNSPIPQYKGFIYLGSACLGLLFSFLIISARKLISQKIDDPHWSEKHLNIVNLAIVPYCKEQTINSLQYKKNQSKNIPLLAHTNPRNLAIEAIRSLRTSLQVSLSCANNNIISIMGVAPGVGKSFISSNLAYLLAAAGKKVLLIDGDLRKGFLHKNFNIISPVPGLSELINNNASFENALHQVHENLSLLTRGTYPTDPSEMLSSNNFKKLILELSKQFEVVIIDTAPVLLVTDAVLIGALSATNYLVLGASVHQSSEIEMAIKRFGNAGVQIHGSIFNFFNGQTKNQYYSKYYDTYYYEDSKQS
jgi:tyrosine-protein kinase Etk/Wzc